MDSNAEMLTLKSQDSSVRCEQPVIQAQEYQSASSRLVTILKD